MTYRGHVKNGTVVLDAPVSLEEGLEVEIVVSGDCSSHPGKPGQTLHDRLKPFIGIVNDMPSDASECLDYYLAISVQMA